MADHATRVRLLGFCVAGGLDALRTALAGSAGPALHLVAAAGVGVAAQVEPAGGRFRALDRAGLLRRLHAVQRRLELACQAGPFLPVDPAAAPLRCRELPRLVAAAAPRLIEALGRDGSRQQWDVTVSWPAEAVLAPHRAALTAVAPAGAAAVAELVGRLLRQERDNRRVALLAALRPRVAALSEGPAGDTEITLTVLVPAGGEAAIEDALGSLPAAASADAEASLRGPLPPVSFAACRVAELAAGEIEAAWRLLELDGVMDATALRRHWRRRAATLHPDHTGDAADGARLDAAGKARLLLAPLLDAAGPCGLPGLLALAGRRLVPAEPLEPEPVARPAADLAA